MRTNGATELHSAPKDFNEWFKGEDDDLPAGLTYQEWAQWGMRLRARTTKLEWKIIQWLLYGERRYGESYTQAVESTGYDRGYLHVLASVGQSTILMRHKNLERTKFLPFSYWQCLAPLPSEHQQFLLDRLFDAEGNVLFTRDGFRGLVKEYRKEAGLLPPAQPPSPKRPSLGDQVQADIDAERKREAISTDSTDSTDSTESDTDGWPVPNEYGVYSKELAEMFEFERGLVKVQLFVLHAREGWLTGISIDVGNGGSSSPISRNSRDAWGARHHAVIAVAEEAKGRITAAIERTDTRKAALGPLRNANGWLSDLIAEAQAVGSLLDPIETADEYEPLKERIATLEAVNVELRHQVEEMSVQRPAAASVAFPAADESYRSTATSLHSSFYAALTAGGQRQDMSRRFYPEELHELPLEERWAKVITRLVSQLGSVESRLPECGRCYNPATEGALCWECAKAEAEE